MKWITSFLMEAVRMPWVADYVFQGMRGTMALSPAAG